MDLIVLGFYGIIFLFYIFSMGLSLESLVGFSLVFITSGFVYASAIIAIFTLLTYFVKNNLITKSKFVINIAFLLITMFIYLNYYIENTSIKEILQFVTITSLLIHLKNISKSNEQLIFKSCYGFFIGGVLIALNVFISEIFLGGINQDNFNYFSISSTYNYSAYYLIVSFLIAPAILEFSSFYKNILLSLLVVIIFILSARLALITVLMCYFLWTFVHKGSFKSVIYIPVILFAVLYFLLSASILNPDDQNDIIYSIINFQANFSNIERITQIYFSYQSLIDRPFGYGLGNAEVGMANYGLSYPHAHNLIATYLYELGYIGLVVSTLFYFYLINILLKKRDIICILGVFIIFVNSMTDALQYNILLSIITIFILILSQIQIPNEDQGLTLS